MAEGHISNLCGSITVYLQILILINLSHTPESTSPGLKYRSPCDRRPFNKGAVVPISLPTRGTLVYLVSTHAFASIWKASSLKARVLQMMSDLYYIDLSYSLAFIQGSPNFVHSC